MEAYRVTHEQQNEWDYKKDSNNEREKIRQIEVIGRRVMMREKSGDERIRSI